MDKEAHINQMLNEGKISLDQAQLLKKALYESWNAGTDMVNSPEPEKIKQWPGITKSRILIPLIALVIALALSIKVKPLFFFLLMILMILGGIAALLLLGYNLLVWKHEKVQQSKTLVQNEISRKSVLVPQIRDVVYKYVSLETDAIERTTQMRTSGPSSDLDSQKGLIPRFGMAKEFQAIVENYPQLKSSESFTKFLNELIETEDRITSMMKWYNHQAEKFNRLIESFPMSTIANIVGLQRAVYLDE